MAIYTEEVQLKDGLSPAAKAAAENVKTLEHQMTVLQKSLTAAQDKMTKASALGDIAGFRKAKGEVAQLTAGIGDLSPKVAGAKQELAALTQKTQGATGASMDLQAELAELTGGLSILVEVVGAVALGFGVLVAAGAKFAIEASEAKTQALALWTALGEGKTSGDQVDDMLDGMRAKLGITKDAMTPWANQLMAMGVVELPQLEEALTATAAAAALAKGGGDVYLGMQKKIQAAAEAGTKLTVKLKDLSSMGLTVTDVATKMGVSATELGAQLKAGSVDAAKFGKALNDALAAKGGDSIKAMSLSVQNLGGLFKEYIADMFEDLGPAIRPFLEQVKDLFGIFDSKTKPSGQALKAGIEGFFKQVFAIAAKVVPMVKHFLLDVIIFGLKAYIALKPIVKTLQDMWKQHGGMQILIKAFNVMKPLLIVIGVAIGVVVLAFAALWAMMVGIGVVILAVTGFIVKGISEGIGALWDLAKVLGEWSMMGLKYAGDFVMGIVNGIKSGVGMVVDAVTNLAGSAKGAFKKALGIASPSKVGKSLGGNFGGSIGEGMSAAAPDVHAAGGELAGAAAGGFSKNAGGGGASASAGASITVHIDQLNVDAKGASGAEELSETIFAVVFERLAIANGYG